MARQGSGLYLRGKVWMLDFRHQSTRHVIKIGKSISRSVAAEIANVKRAAILKGEAGIGRKRKDLAFEEARDRFLEAAEVSTKPRTLRVYKQHCVQLSKSFEGKRLGQITALDVERHKMMRAKSGARVCANREVACLRNIFNTCIRTNVFEGSNPALCGKVHGIKKIKESAGRTVTLEQAEEARVLSHCPEPLRSLVVVGLNTGVRIAAEALSLQWKSVDLRRKTLTVESAHAKNNKARTIPLNQPAIESLGALKAASRSEFVFCQPNGRPYVQVEKPFRAALRAANAYRKGVGLHVLRHTWATRMVEAGCDLRTLMDLGGWSSLAMVQRYTHTGQHRAAVDRLAEFHNAFHNNVISLPTETACG